MKLVEFTREMRPYAKGETRVVPDDVAAALIAAGEAVGRPSVYDDQPAPAPVRRPGYRTRRLLGLAVAVALASPVGAQAQAISVTQTVVTLSAGTDAVLAAADPYRRFLCLQNIDTGLVTLAFDAVAVAGTGTALEAATASGHQGGSQCFGVTGGAANVVHGISTAGSRVAVQVGK